MFHSKHHPMVQVGCMPCIIGCSDTVGAFWDDAIDFAGDVVTAPARAVVTAVSNVPSAAVNTGKAIASAASALGPYVQQAIPIAQLALKNFPPMGTVASAALGAMQAGLTGGNLEEIAWAAAEGAAPTGVDTALRAAHSLRNGDPVINVALSVARQQIAPGSAADAGFRAGETLLRGGTLSQAAVNAARTQLGNAPQAIAAFNAAIGTVARAQMRETGGVSSSGARLPKLVTTASAARIPPLVSTAASSAAAAAAASAAAAAAARAAAIARPAQAAGSAPRIVPLVTTAADIPKPLPLQPILTGPTPGLLVLSDGQIRSGVFSPGTSGVVRGLLVLADGRINRNLFRVG